MDANLLRFSPVIWSLIRFFVCSRSFAKVTVASQQYTRLTFQTTQPIWSHFWISAKSHGQKQKYGQKNMWNTLNNELSYQNVYLHKHFCVIWICLFFSKMKNKKCVFWNVYFQKWIENALEYNEFKVIWISMNSRLKRLFFLSWIYINVRITHNVG